MKMRFTSTKVKGKLICTIITSFLIVFTLYCKYSSGKYEAVTDSKERDLPFWERTLDFEKLNFSNVTGHPHGHYLVPNYVHYVSFGGNPINYIQMICILAALKNQDPDKLFFHYDKNNTFSGKYWNVLEKLPKFKNILVLNQIELPDEIFGQPLSANWRRWHGSDIVRIKMIMKYGGIYLDADCYMIKSVDKYRRFEMTVNWDEGQFIGNQVLIGHKDARFLKKYLDTYKVYKADQWYYNGGERPTVEILYKEPELIHRVKVLFGADTSFAVKLFQQRWEGWREMYILHLLSQHQYLFKNLNKKAVFPVKFDENNIGYYNITFREMAYEVYDFANIKWPKTRYITDERPNNQRNHKKYRSKQ